MKSSTSILFILVISGLVSCSLFQGKPINDAKIISDSAYINDPMIYDNGFFISLSEFAQTIELDKLCTPIRIYFSFTIDTAGNISNPSILPAIFDNNTCTIDSMYLKNLEEKFLISMPLWKPANFNDSTTEIRYSIPVIFR